MIKTVADLKKYLTDHDESPEALGKRIRLSNMTIRRLLARDPRTQIPGKYATQLGQLDLAAVDMDRVIQDLEKAGSRKVNLTKLRADLIAKVKDSRISGILRQNIEAVAEIAFHSPDAKARAFAIGALLYLINPMDLMPDLVSPMGYLDDFAIFSWVTGFLASRGRPLRKLNRASVPAVDSPSLGPV